MLNGVAEEPRSTSASVRAAEILGLDQAARPLSAPALRRPAPARGHGPRHRARSAGVPVRRAAVQPRCASCASHMRAEIKELHQRLKTTTVYVTHDQIEAMTMADKIVVMHDGMVEQIGAPLELYDSPANLFVAGLHRLAGDEHDQGQARSAKSEQLHRNRRHGAAGRAAAVGGKRARPRLRPAAGIYVARPERVCRQCRGLSSPPDTKRR